MSFSFVIQAHVHTDLKALLANIIQQNIRSVCKMYFSFNFANVFSKKIHF